MRPGTTLGAGVALGAVLGLAYVLAGPLTLLPGLVVVAWLLRRRSPLVGLAGCLLGFGAMWLVLVGQLLVRCANDPSCTVPDARLWLAIGGLVVAAGAALGLLARAQPRDAR